MTTSSYPEITDELLSAYIDGAVSDAERDLIEKAVREDATVAWRLDSLRHTVNLLRTLPVLQAPRSFVLTAEQLAQPVHTPALVPGVVVADQRAAPDAHPPRIAQQTTRRKSLLERWRGFWQTGSPVWRNAMAASMATLLVLMIAPTFLSLGRHSEPTAASVALVRENATRQEAPIASEAHDSVSLIEQGESSAPKATASIETAAMQPDSGEESVMMATVMPETTAPEIAEAAVATFATEDAFPEGATVGEAPVAASNLAPGLSVARIASPMEREGDPLNPMPPVEASAETGLGVTAIEEASAPLMAVPAAAPPTTASEEIIAGEEAVTATSLLDLSSEEMATTAANVEESPSGDAVLADSDGIVPAPERTQDGITVQAVGAQAVGAQAIGQDTATHADDVQSTAMAPTAQTSSEVVTRAVAAVQVKQWLPWLQLVLAGAVVLFGLLWQRSRQRT